MHKGADGPLSALESAEGGWYSDRLPERRGAGKATCVTAAGRLKGGVLYVKSMAGNRKCKRPGPEHCRSSPLVGRSSRGDGPRSPPPRRSGKALDVADEEAAKSAVNAAVKAFGRLDVVVNNAGYGDVAPRRKGKRHSVQLQALAGAGIPVEATEEIGLRLVRRPS